MLGFTHSDTLDFFSLAIYISWSNRISSIIKKSKRLLSLIYRQFYTHSSTKTLLSLYTTLVRPILEYGSPVWDPSSTSLSSSLEAVQHFALKLIFKSWSCSYSSLLSSLKIPTLEHRRKKSKLILFYKINNDLQHTTVPLCQHIISTYSSLRNFCPANYLVPFCAWKSCIRHDI